jgi:hypothetical protein
MIQRPIKPMYDQSLVNENMENLLELESGSTEKVSNISETKPKRKYSKKSPSRGGKREGAGRPKGTTNKVSPVEMLNDFSQRSGMQFHEFINEQIVLAYQAGDKELVSRYLLGFAKYLVQDVQEIKQDVTSNGQTMGVQLMFNPVELPEWKNETSIH